LFFACRGGFKVPFFYRCCLASGIQRQGLPSPSFPVRSTEADLFIGDPRRARDNLGWRHETSLRELMREMLMADLEIMRDGPIVKHP
jgi:nucleoside-diphosphate-sugar epimerase